MPRGERGVTSPVRAGAWVALASLLACGSHAARSTVEKPSDERDESPAAAFAAEPTIRVGVAWGDTAVALGGTGRWWIRESGETRPIAVVEEAAPWSIVRLPFEIALRIARPDGWLSRPHAGPLVAAPLDRFPLEVEGTAYPGSIEIRLRPDGSVTAVNVVPVETYLEGVVAKELGRPGAGAREALRAQAVAARSYALRRLGSRAPLGFDVYGSILDQAYAGVPTPGDTLAVAAVRDTRGEAILHEGSLIDAYYHSTCGGSTARVDLVFDAPPAPYLTVVDDRRPDGGFWCQPSRYFRWTATYTGDELRATIARNLPGLVPPPEEGTGDLRDLEVTRSTPEGRALAVRVETSTGRYVVSGDAIRRLFADTDGRWLRSTLFLYRPRREGGRLTGATLVGGGWGHGVGMCQVGAMERARAGHGYREILAAYYRGTDVVALYR